MVHIISAVHLASTSLIPSGLCGTHVLVFSRSVVFDSLPIPSSVDLPDPGIEPGSPALQVDSLPAELAY